MKNIVNNKVSCHLRSVRSLPITVSGLAQFGFWKIICPNPQNFISCPNAASFFVYSKDKHSAVGGQIVNKKLGENPNCRHCPVLVPSCRHTV